eukprot:TRINITY_DN10839_c0_g1_i1.p1 TRINITY_DN10839_c0_g1~~TRINITY_DN10839_c0_g1_i1.p1  ORF type:complete len:640 (+),score=226.75 TRINITY_DN10839_c0_g1_i1:175-2094(+)
MSAQVAPTPAANVPAPGTVMPAGAPMMGAPAMMAGGPMPIPAEAQTASASLYVGDLSPEVSEANLFETFNAVGPVVSIRVCRDSITRRSLGYAYVNFQYKQDAEKAMDELNYENIGNRPCRIMWSQRDPIARRNAANNIFIKNLESTIDNKQLYDTFGAFGDILSCKVACNDKGESRGYGFVHFKRKEDAETAIEKVDGKMLKDKVVSVTKFISRKDREAQQGERKFTNVFVKNLPASMEKDAMHNLFAEFGTITSCFISPPSNKTPPRRYGFINFEKPEDAVKAVEAMNDKEVEEDCKLFVGRAMKKTERERILKRQYEERQRELDAKNRGVNLYVKHLADDVTEEDLHELFGQFGTIKSLRIMVDSETKASRGFGFVCYDDAESATNAMTELHQKPFHEKPLYVALALRKADRQNQLAQERAMRSRSMGMPGGFMPPYMQQQMMMRNMGRFPMGMMNMMQNPAMFNKQQQAMNGGMPPMGGRQGGRGGRGARGRSRGRGRGGQQQHQGHPMNQAAPQMMPPQQQMQQQQQQPPQPQPQPPQPQQPQQAAAANRGTANLASTLAGMAPEMAKRHIGEQLYPRIAQMHGPEPAGKITGMLLEMDNSELLLLLENEPELKQRVDEAFNVLQKYKEKPAQA